MFADTRTPRRLFSRLLCLGLFLLIFCAIPTSLRAATLSLSPVEGVYTVGSTFTVSINTGSRDKAMNAASGSVTFPIDKMQVVSLSKAKSIFNLWVEEPSFSNTKGTVNFEGVVLNPGYTGAKGEIISVVFKVKAAGRADLKYSASAVLANDGLGTNILDSVSGASYVFGPTSGNATTPGTTEGVPVAPDIKSPTHPDSEKWYSISSPSFEWDNPTDATSVRILNNTVPYSTPTVVYTPAIDEKSVPSVSDGIWYFHVQLRNRAGWGAIAHYRYQVDTEKPNLFEIQAIHTSDATEPRVTFSLKATDKTSGIDHFELQVDQNPVVIVPADKTTFEVGPLLPGKHLLLGKAVDRAGNALASSYDFSIGALKPPVFTDYPRSIESGKLFLARGSTEYPLSTVEIHYGQDEASMHVQTVQADTQGGFTFIADSKLTEGVYTIYGIVIDSRGAHSLKSDDILVAVDAPLLIKFIRILKEYLALLVLVLTLLAAIIFFIIFIWKRARKYRDSLLKETEEAEMAVHNAFIALQDEVEDQIARLDGKDDLTEREMKVVKDLRAALRTSEKYITKELKDIETKIKKKK